MGKDINPLNKLLRLITVNKLEKVCVEAGHIYCDQKPGAEHTIGFGIGSEICNQLISKGIVPHRLVFIDNYNPEKNDFCLKNYIEVANSFQFEPAEIVWEADLVEEAEQLIQKLINADQTTNDQNGRLVTKKSSIKLRSSRGTVGCCALDAALYVRRFKNYDFNITVLPKTNHQNYKDQQQGVRRILRLLGYEKLNLANIFFSEDGSFTVGLAD